MQGSPADEPGREADEIVREVTLTHATFLTRTLVTVGDFRAFVEATGYRTDAENGAGGLGWDGKSLAQKPTFTWKNPGFPQEASHPVVLVTVSDATAFARWVDCTNDRHDRHLRLPTEAELERAARGNDTTFSPTWAAKVGVFKGASIGTQPVASKGTNVFGLADVVGNASSWTLDMYNARSSDEAIDPTDGDAGSGSGKRVVKGGSWNHDARRGRPAARAGAPEKSASAEIGFRLAFVAADKPEAGAGARFEPPLTLAQKEPVHEAPPEPEPESSSFLLDVVVAAAVIAGGVFIYRALRKKGD